MTAEKIARELGFNSEDALREASRSIATVGDFTWFIARLSDGRFAAWDDAGGYEVFDSFASALRHQLDGLDVELEDGDEGVSLNWPGIYSLIASRLAENARDTVDALNALVAWDTGDATEEREAVAADTLDSFARHAGLTQWRGKVVEDSPTDYWPVTGGIGLSETIHGWAVIGWLSEVTTEAPIFYLLPQ